METPQRFWQGMPKAATISLLDKILIGINADGSTKYGDVNQIVALIEATGSDGFKGPALADTNPGLPTKPQYYSAKPGVTYANFKDGAGTPISIPTKVGANYVINAKLVFSGNWQAIYDLITVELDNLVTEEELLAEISTIKPQSLPPNITDISINDPDTYLSNSAFGNTGPRTCMPTKSSYYTVAYSGLVKRFFCKFSDSQIGRIIRFYLVSKSGSIYTAKYDSGDIVAESAGINYFTPPFGTVKYEVGDYIAVYANMGEQLSELLGANGSEESAFLSGIPVVGQPFPGTVNVNSTIRFAVGADITPPNAIAGSSWGGKPNGFAKLDENSRLYPNQMPTQVSGDVNHEEVATQIFLPEKSLPAIVRNSGGIEHYKASSLAFSGGSAGNFLTNRIIVALHESLGFANDGILTEVRVGPNSVVQSTSKLQAWVVRPNNGKLILLQKIGELDASVANRWHVFKGLSIFVKKGDAVAIRGIDLQIKYQSGSTSQTNHKSYQLNLSDLTMDALKKEIPASAGVLNSGVAWNVEADISLSSIGAYPVLDENLHLKNSFAKAPDLYWQGKKIIWVGTSIPAGNTGGYKSYPVLVGEFLDTNLVNESVGSSGIIWDGTRLLSLSATSAELIANYGANQGGYSYENKLIGKGADLIVFDHGYNDRPKATGASLGTLPFTIRTGRISGSTASQTLTGVNTLFSTEFKAGDKLYDFRFRYIGKVLSIESNTSMTLTSNSLVAISNADVFYGTSMDRTTFYGAFNYVIDKCYDDKPTVSIMFVTSPTEYAYQAAGGDGRAANTNARDAVVALANAYNAPCCDLFNLMGYNGSNWPARAADNVHPNETERIKAAHMLYHFIKGVV